MTTTCQRPFPSAFHESLIRRMSVEVRKEIASFRYGVLSKSIRVTPLDRQRSRHDNFQLAAAGASHERRWDA
jgi:hypothetical protein